MPALRAFNLVTHRSIKMSGLTALEVAAGIGMELINRRAVISNDK